MGVLVAILRKPAHYHFGSSSLTIVSRSLDSFAISPAVRLERATLEVRVNQPAVVFVMKILASNSWVVAQAFTSLDAFDSLAWDLSRTDFSQTSIGSERQIRRLGAAGWKLG